MKIAPLPENEEARIAALKSYAIMDTDPEQYFDQLTWLAAKIFGVPIAVVSLVDSNRQWFKSCFGLDATETDRDLAFCSHAILGDEVFEISDASKDERFADNPLVTGPPNIRFYAGKPLIDSNGYALGTLCLIGTAPGKLSSIEKEILSVLTETVMTRMEYRRSLAEVSIKTLELELAVKSEQQARKTAEIASKAKSHFLTAVSHELRTPLNAIIGFGELLAEDVDQNTLAESKKDIHNIINSGHHLLGMIDEVLDLSAIEKGSIKLDVTKFSIAELVDELTEVISPLIKKNKNVLQIAMSQKLGDMIGDRQKLHQVLFKLLSNAAKYTHDGIISLDVRHNSKNELFEFTVKDLGIGMDKKVIDQLFEPFSQAGNSNPQGIASLGIGLTISRHYIELMGGKIEVESQTGTGSIFYVSLPMALSAEDYSNSIQQMDSEVKNTKEMHSI